MDVRFNLHELGSIVVADELPTLTEVLHLDRDRQRDPYSVGHRLGLQPLPVPTGCRSLITNPVVEAVLTVLPEFEVDRIEPVASPPRRTEHRPIPEGSLQLSHAVIQLLPISNHAALRRSRRAYLAAPRTASEIHV